MSVFPISSVDALLLPIRDTAPGGGDARYSSEYELLQAEIDKRSSLTGFQKVDWQVVADLAFSILVEQSKDLLVAAYLAASLCHLDGLAGFTKGVELVDGFCRRFWNSMHPSEKRMQGRVNAVDWWMENSGNFLRMRPGMNLLPSGLRQIKKRITDLDAFLHSKNPDFPNLAPLLRHIDKLEEPEIPEKTSEESASEKQDSSGGGQPSHDKPATAAASRPSSGEPVASPVSPSGPGAQDSPGRQTPAGTQDIPEIVPITSDEELVLAESRLSALASAICAWQLPRALDTPVYYSLNRLAAWAGIDSLPRHTEGKTDRAPADVSFRELLFDLRGRGEWEHLLVRAELMLRSHPFWLDLCRLVDESLAALGEQYTRARSLCATLTVEFLERLPGVEGLAYADGTSFADAATRKWLAGLASSRGSGKTLSLEDTLNRAREEAMAFIRAGDIHEAARRVQQGLDLAASSGERYRWRILLGQILTEAGQESVARVHFDMLLEMIDQHRLEEWDRELALAGLRAAYGGIRAEDSESILELRLALLKKITRLSTLGALETLNVKAQ